MSRYSIETLERGLSVLSLFSNDTSELTLTEISRAADINMTTSLRIASTLEGAGYLRRDPETKRYRPSLKVLQLGFSALRSMDIRQSARPYLELLSKETGETVSLAVLDGLEIVYVDRIRNRQIVGVVLGMGSRLPAHCTSMGKAMLAYLPEDRLKTRLNGADLQACTGNTISETDSLEADLAKVRRRGYAVNNQELAVGLRAVAAPIWGEHGQVVAAINISGSTETISRSRLKQDLVPCFLRRRPRYPSRLVSWTGTILETCGECWGVGRNPGDRFHSSVGRPLLHDDARRPWGGCNQGGTARIRRRYPTVGSALDRRGERPIFSAPIATRKALR